MSTPFGQQLDEYIRARHSLIYIVTWEEDRARDIIVHMAAHRRKDVYEWSVTDGLRSVQAQNPAHRSGERTREPMAVLNEILQADTDAVYILKDFHPNLDKPEVIRQLRDLSDALRRSRKCLLLVSPTLTLPIELEKQITVLDLPLPGEDELRRLLERIVGESRTNRRFQVDLTPEQEHALIQATRGLTIAEAENAYALAIVRDGRLDGDDIQAIIEEKRQVIRKSGGLEYCDTSDDISDVGGMDILKDWLERRKRAFTEEARKYGLPHPRGILLMGVQGCGKSLLAKTVAQQWQIPLLRMDMSRIFQGYIGSSEQNMRRALDGAESLAPVVLWIDEIEKAFAGMESSGAADSGTTSRVVGLFLTWLQEKAGPVFVVATANEVRNLPPELLRKGRLDEIFFVDLPRRPERQEILDIHLRKRRRDPEKFDMRALRHACKGYSGAEIEQAIVSAMHDSFFEDREVETRDILKSFQEQVPLSTTMRERIEDLRGWARDRARPVSSLVTAPAAEKETE